MKKFTVLVLFGLLIMAFSATVYAQPLEFKASGLVTTTAYWYQNIPTGGIGAGNNFNITGFFPAPFQPVNPATLANQAAFQQNAGAWNRPNAYLANRMNLVFDANIGKELSGRLAMEIDAMRWGTHPTEGSGNSSQGDGRSGRWRADATAIEIKHAYFDAALPYFGIPVPMTIRVGLQPLGYRPHITMITDGMGVTGGIKLDPVTVAPMWAKAIEGKDAVSDDVDVYGLQATAKLGTLSLGGYAIYFNMNTYPLNVGPGSFGGGPPNGAGTPLSQVGAYGLSPANKADFTWWGLFLDGKAGPVNLQFDGVMDNGTVHQRENPPAGTIRARDVHYRGYVGRLKVEYPWQKFSFGGVGVYGSGADLHETGYAGLPGEGVANSGDFRPVTSPSGQALNTARKVSSFVVPPGSESAAITGDDFFIFGNFVTLEAAPLNMATASGTLTNVVHRGAYGGLWFLKAFAAFKATPWYKVTVEALYLGDTTKAGNTFGNAVEVNAIRDPSLPAGNAGRKLKDDDDIGWEFNIINEINIYKNLKWDIGAGYLIAGDALDQMVSNTTVGPVRYNKSPHNPWIVASKLRYTF